MREYILPLYTIEEEQRLSRKRRAILSEIGRFKYSGPDCCPRTKVGKRKSVETDVGSFQFLECKVVPEQPLLRIRRASVTHGALMLYDGEKYVEIVQGLPSHFFTFCQINSSNNTRKRLFHSHRFPSSIFRGLDNGARPKVTSRRGFIRVRDIRNRIQPYTQTRVLVGS